MKFWIIILTMGFGQTLIGQISSNTGPKIKNQASSERYIKKGLPIATSEGKSVKTGPKTKNIKVGDVIPLKSLYIRTIAELHNVQGPLRKQKTTLSKINDLIADSTVVQLKLYQHVQIQLDSLEKSD